MKGADFIAIIILAAIVIAVCAYLLHWLYRRSTKDISFVRTGFGGEKVVMGGGAFVLPILHDITEVNMNTLRLEITRAREKSLITKDRMRVELTVEFYVRVQPEDEAVATAARSLGNRTMHAEQLKDLIQGRFVDAMGGAAAKMTLEQIHEHRQDFVKEVRKEVAESLAFDGLELESVSLTSLDQTVVYRLEDAQCTPVAAMGVFELRQAAATDQLAQVSPSEAQAKIIETVKENKAPINITEGEEIGRRSNRQHLANIFSGAVSANLVREYLNMKCFAGNWLNAFISEIGKSRLRVPLFLMRLQSRFQAVYFCGCSRESDG